MDAVLKEVRKCILRNKDKSDYTQHPLFSLAPKYWKWSLSSDNELLSWRCFAELLSKMYIDCNPEAGEYVFPNTHDGRLLFEKISYACLSALPVEQLPKLYIYFPHLNFS